jgi:hypothetical protein
MLQRLSMLILLLVALLGSPVQADEGGKWFRGQLHAHSYWSDGRGFPDQAVAAYKQRGYDFFCLSDHNRLADDPNVWRKVVAEEGSWPPNVTQANFDACVQAFGRDWVESKTEGAQTSVRLKTYAEIKAKFDEPGRFLFMPGGELTQTINGYSVHMNYINLPEILPCIKGSDLIKTVTTPGTVSELIGVNATEAKQMADKLQRPYLLMLNHPLWVYYDVAPQNLIDNPGDSSRFVTAVPTMPHTPKRRITTLKSFGMWSTPFDASKINRCFTESGRTTLIFMTKSVSTTFAGWAMRG